MPKGALSDSERAEMRDATHEMASALADDLQHIRETAGQKAITPGEARRLSNELRRILIHGDLRKVAAPRVGRIALVAPDLQPLYRANEVKPFLFMMADSVNAMGTYYAAVAVEKGEASPLPGFDPDGRVQLSVDTFLNQRIICHLGRWVSRADVIKYIANVASGVHTTDPSEAAHLQLQSIRRAVTVSAEEGCSIITWNVPIAALEPPLSTTFKRVDAALLALIGTAQHLTSSPAIIELEQIIAESG
jgi:hypothetical protein